LTARVTDTGKIDNAFISFRIGLPLWEPEVTFASLLNALRGFPGLTNDISLFTTNTCPPLPIEVLEGRALILAKRISQARSEGYKVGINHHPTIGQHNENLPHALSTDYARMTDINGCISAGTLCFNDERVRAYIRDSYAAFAAADPDYIWIDDDVRLLGHLPIAAGCFCDNCLSIFETESGTCHTRESLSSAFNTGPIEKKLRVRRAWLDHNRAAITRLFELIESTVHATHPRMPLGFMTGDRFFEGYDFAAWARALAGPDGVEVLWRPGGGFYDDDRLKGMAEKSHDAGRQVAALPDSVVCIQSEVENFPYQCLRKSARVTALEAASHIASGCTGAAFNVFTWNPPLHADDPFGECRPIVANAAELRPFYDLLATTLGRSKPLGIYTGWNRDTFIASNISDGDWFTGNAGASFAAHASEILEIGLPAAYAPESASVTVLSGDSVLALSDDEIVSALSSGVYMDASALTRLNEMGYEDLTGFAVVRFIAVDGIEEFTAHPLNEESDKQQRDARQSFVWWTCPAAVLIPQRDGAQTLARLIDYADEATAECCMGVFENRLGGRVCVAGYYPWTYLQSLSKSRQIKSVMRWLSKDSLPAYIGSYHKMNLWVRKLDDDRTAAVVLNASLDPAQDATLLTKADADTLTVYDTNCEEQVVESHGSDGPYKAFVLPHIGAWDMRLVVI
jgi:hypothetical protein